jgi:hypothetical protein
VSLLQSSGRVVRCEIVLPKKYNDGSDVEPQKYRLTWDELVERFGGISANDATGGWLYLGRVFREENYIYKFDIKTSVARSELGFLQKEYKETLKARFKQHEIYIIAYFVTRL